MIQDFEVRPISDDEWNAVRWLINASGKGIDILTL